jgi:hypothetical protein
MEAMTKTYFHIYLMACYNIRSVKVMTTCQYLVQGHPRSTAIYRNTRKLTISKKNRPATIPSVEDDLFEHHFGHQVAGRPVNVLSKSEYFSILATGKLKDTNLPGQGFGGFRTPLGVAERIVSLGGFLVQEMDHHPAHRVLLCSTSPPLHDSTIELIVEEMKAKKAKTGPGG